MKCKENQDEYFELNTSQINELISITQFKSNDIFFDLGCATGKVAREVVKQTNVKMAIGIERDFNYYDKARKCAIQELTKDELNRIDFWFGDIRDYGMNEEDSFAHDYSKATVVFASIDEQFEDFGFYRDRFNLKRLRIIKKDIPLIGYPSKPNRNNKKCWFFLTKPPFRRIGKKKWIKSVRDDFDTFDKIYDYYYKQLMERFREEKGLKSKEDAANEARQSLENLKNVIRRKFV